MREVIAQTLNGRFGQVEQMPQYAQCISDNRFVCRGRLGPKRLLFRAAVKRLLGVTVPPWCGGAMRDKLRPEKADPCTRGLSCLV